AVYFTENRISWVYVQSLSEKTVSTYKTRLLQKLNIKSVVYLAEFAKRNNLIE
ncbi:MAG: LuxR C-terminal-related transcriptional regulator, partial [Pseudomonas helleri]